jgi:hypothetical protein
VTSKYSYGRVHARRPFLLFLIAFSGVTLAFGQPAIPTGETTAWGGFDAGMTCGGGGNCVTVGMWNQALTPANVNFNGRTVTEQSPGAGNDTCHFNGSAVATFDAVTGGNWAVGANNAWGPDYVGWFLAAVTYYRNRGRAPCGTTFQQRMVIDVNAGTRVYGGNNTGDTNTLGGNINVRSVTSSRSGNTNTLNR